MLIVCLMQLQHVFFYMEQDDVIKNNLSQNVIVKELLELICKRCILQVKDQLVNFLPGDQLRDLTETVPLTNIPGEFDFGLLKYLKNSQPKQI